VAAYTAASEAVHTEDDVLVIEGPASVSAEASAVFRGIKSSGRADGGAGRSYLTAGKYTVAEPVEEAEDLIVTEGGIDGGLGDDVRGGIKGVVGGCVVAVACARFTQQEIIRVSMGGKRALRVLHGYGERHLMVEVFGEANAVLAREGEPDVVPRVDGRGPGVVGFAQVIAGGDACLVFGHQTPH